MSPKHSERIKELVSGFFSSEDLEKISGLKSVPQWANLFAKTEKIRIMRGNGLIDRGLLEKQLYKMGFTPTKVAAIRLGMSQRDLEKVMFKLGNEIMLPQYSKDYGIIHSEYLKSFQKNLTPANEIYTNQTIYIRKLHRILALQSGVSIKTIFCKFSEKLGEKNVGYSYDCITDEPLSLKYKIDLDFNKPISLEPDGCSPVTFLKYEVELNKFVIGGEIPSHIAKAMKSL
jgi:hypothetical protein